MHSIPTTAGDARDTKADDARDSDRERSTVIGRGSSISIGLVAGLCAGLISFAGQLAWSAFWFGGKFEAQRREILEEVARGFVSREVAETRWGASSATTNAELAIIRRDLSELREIAKQIPRMSAQIDALAREDKGR